MVMPDDTEKPEIDEALPEKDRKLELEQKALRAYTKSLTWAGVSSIDTLAIGLVLIHSPAQAAGVAGIGSALKFAVLYPLHEAVWGKIPFGINNPETTHWRALAKTLTYRTMGIVETFALVMFLPDHSVKKAASVAAVEFVTKSVLYFGHEEAWKKVGHERLWRVAGTVVQNARSAFLHHAA